MFGVLGYELDFGELTRDERRQIKEQVEFYKNHRALLQYGRFMRYFPCEGERESWQINRDGKAVAAIYNLSYHASPARDTLRILCAEDGKTYEVKSVKQYLRIGRFGSLVKHISPVNIKSDGAIMRLVDRNFSMVDGRENYISSGEALQSGISLAMQYSGTGYDSHLRILGDGGSTAYTVSELSEKSKMN
jgi:alpha-galactosidase